MVCSQRGKAARRCSGHAASSEGPGGQEGGGKVSWLRDALMLVSDPKRTGEALADPFGILSWAALMCKVVVALALQCLSSEREMESRDPRKRWSTTRNLFLLLAIRALEQSSQLSELGAAFALKGMFSSPDPSC